MFKNYFVKSHFMQVIVVTSLSQTLSEYPGYEGHW